jgi:hypothetical protein
MTSWQIRALHFEESALEHFSRFIAEHALALAVGLILILMAVGIWVLVRGLGRKPPEGKSGFRVPPPIIIQVEAPARPTEPEFDPFPPPHYCRECERDPDEWED